MHFLGARWDMQQQLLLGCGLIIACGKLITFVRTRWQNLLVQITMVEASDP